MAKKKTSPGVASKAGKALANPKTPKAARPGNASALSQREKPKKGK